MSDLKAIETRYKGYRFRSRLEARWAVFFDALGVAWEYEKEGFDLDGLRYLPDFWLPTQQCWIEVKGGDARNVWYAWDDHSRKYRQRLHHPRTGEPNGHAPRPDVMEDFTKVRRLAEASGFPVFVFFNELCPLGFDSHTDEVVGSAKGWYPDGKHDDGCCTWGECPLCRVLAPAPHGQHEVCQCVCNQPFAPPDRPGNWGRCRTCDASDYDKKGGEHRPWCNSRTDRIVRAFQTAKAARFEHGETPT